jgi:hypothetical protein
VLLIVNDIDIEHEREHGYQRDVLT